MKNLKGLRRALSWPTGINLHEGTKGNKVFSLRIVGVPVQFQTCICRSEHSYRYANLFGWNSSL